MNYDDVVDLINEDLESEYSVQTNDRFDKSIAIFCDKLSAKETYTCFEKALTRNHKNALHLLKLFCAICWGEIKDNDIFTEVD